MEYRTENWSVSVSFYPVDGVQICVRNWTDDEWVEVVDSRFICDSFWEAMFCALTEAGLNSEHAAWQLAEWNIVEPSDEDEEDN
jgi:hypothetical protein